MCIKCVFFVYKCIKLVINNIHNEMLMKTSLFSTKRVLLLCFVMAGVSSVRGQTGQINELSGFPKCDT